MSYVTRAEIETEIPPKLLIDALDDDKDRQEDNGLLDKIVAKACSDVDGILGQRFAVPFQSPPPVVSRAARILVLATLYRRRQVPEDRNPYSRAERDVLETLRRIAAGSESLMPGATRGDADIEYEPARTADPGGRISL